MNTVSVGTTAVLWFHRSLHQFPVLCVARPTSLCGEGMFLAEAGGSQQVGMLSVPSQPSPAVAAAKSRAAVMRLNCVFLMACVKSGVGNLRDVALGKVRPLTVFINAANTN